MGLNLERVHVLKCNFVASTQSTAGSEKAFATHTHSRGTGPARPPLPAMPPWLKCKAGGVPVLSLHSLT
jgi:hypothetical protein